MIYSNIIDMDKWINDFNGDKDKAYALALRDDEMYRAYLTDKFDAIKADVIAVGEIDGELFAERVGDKLGDIFRFNGLGEIYAEDYKVKGRYYLDNCVEEVTYYRLIKGAPKDIVEKLALGHMEYMSWCVSVYEHFDTYEVAA